MYLCNIMKSARYFAISVLFLLSCSGATLKYTHKPYVKITAAKSLVINFKGAYLNPDSGRVSLSILGTRPDFESFFGMEFDTFFTRSLKIELDSVENWRIDNNSPLLLKFVVDRFILNYRIDDIGEQANGIRYEYVFDCDIEGRGLLKTSDGFVEIPVRGKRHSRWFLYLWGAWQPTLQDELDIMFSQIAEELVKGVSARIR